MFKLQVPKLDEPLSIEGQVRWINEAGSDEPDGPGMGIRFIYNEDSQRAAIEELVEGLMVDSLGRLLTSKLLEFSKESWGDEDELEDETEAGER